MQMGKTIPNIKRMLITKDGVWEELAGERGGLSSGTGTWNAYSTCCNLCHLCAFHMGVCSIKTSLDSRYVLGHFLHLTYVSHAIWHGGVCC